MFRLRAFPLRGKRVCVALVDAGEGRIPKVGSPNNGNDGLVRTDETTAVLKSRIKELEDELERLHEADSDSREPVLARP